MAAEAVDHLAPEETPSKADCEAVRLVRKATGHRRIAHDLVPPTDQVIDWLRSYNHRRLRSRLGYLSPEKKPPADKKSWRHNRSAKGHANRESALSLFRHELR